ncbi:MAG: hypothetical protein JRI68_03215, partial [Deltaproteobacteria bacterium]|nr:hypothetical protein [Deltaproteobacteria bacterium]
MPRLTALLVLWVALTWTSQAEASRVTGDPFVAPLPLAGTWRALAGDQTPAEADGADLDSWHPVEVPGRWKDTALQGHRGLAWYGLDIALEPIVDPADRSLELLLPPFHLAYEVYLNGQLLGSSGSIEPLDRGSLRHQRFAVPPELTGEKTLHLRIRVNAERFAGTYSASLPAGVALGRPVAIAALDELVARRIAAYPQHRASRLVIPTFVGIAALMLLIYLLDRRRREYGWYALMLLSGNAGAYLAAAQSSGSPWYTRHMLALQVVLLLLSSTALFKTVAVMLDLKGKLVTAAFG